jgi:hypothetical protein
LLCEKVHAGQSQPANQRKSNEFWHTYSFH